MPKKRKGMRSCVAEQEPDADDEGKSRTLPTTPPEVHPGQPIILEKSEKTSGAVNPGDMQKMVMEKIKLLQEQRDRQQADNFQNPDYVTKQTFAMYGKLESVLDGIEAKGSIKHIFLEISHFGLYLAKKFPNLTQETQIANARLEKFKALCTQLQKERTMMKKKFPEIEGREKKWREKLEGQFKNSLKEIKDQIGSHEGHNQDIIKHNEKMSERLEIMKKQKALLKEAISVKDKASAAENSRLTNQLKAASSVRDDLSKKLKESVEKNKELETELLSYRGKYNDIQEALQKSGQIIDKVKEEKDKHLAQNRLLSKRNEEYLRNAQSWKEKIDKAMNEKERKDKQVKALQKLVRSLKDQNREFKMKQSEK